MDKGISGWVLEFLLRSSVPDSLIQKTLTALPLSGADNRLKKTILLRTLQSQLLKASLSETTLKTLELLEEIDRNDAVPVFDSMRRAYCSVAVECTVKYLAASPVDPSGEYFSAVCRIWRGRVALMAAAEGGRRSELISSELERWRDDLEAALWDPKVSERLANLNTRRDALNEVKVYLKEAWEMMGPSFLDSVAKISKAKGFCELLRKRDRGLEGSMKDKRDSVDNDRNESHHHVNDDGDDHHVNDDPDENAVVVDDDNDNDNADDGQCCMEGVELTGEKKDKEKLEERVGTSVDANQVVGVCEIPAKRDKAVSPIGIHKGHRQLKRKHSALQPCLRRVKISGPEEIEPENLCSKYESLPSAEVKRVRESLKSSSMELRALVKDPLPNALHTSEVVRSKLATKDTNLEPNIENQSGGIDIPDPNVCMSIVPYQPNDANLGKKTSSHYSNVRRSNFMGRKSTARTDEWDDSIDNLPQGRQPRRRKRRWTSLEEETLRAGVKMFGEGNWATIRNFYSNIFENRSGVDLKDKWRNMIR